MQGGVVLRGLASRGVILDPEPECADIGTEILTKDGALTHACRKRKKVRRKNRTDARQNL